MEYFTWDDDRLGTWDSLEMNWEIVLIQDIIQQSASSGLPLEYTLQQLPKKKTKKLLTILVKLNGEEYIEKKYKSEKNIHITVSEFKQIATAFNIEVI